MTRYMVVLGSLCLALGCADALDEEQVDGAGEVETLRQELRSGSRQAKRSRLARKLDRKLAQAGGADSFKQPESWQYSKIPQDPLNTLNFPKVVLGRLLYHETALLVDNVRPEGRESGSCASCHFVDAGLRSVIRQGIGEGGEGFFHRAKRASYAPGELDVQPIRTPTTLNSAYQEVMLWNGQFGATGPNVGTEAQWTPGTPIANNNLGYQGLETQAIAGLVVHRQSFVRSRVAHNPLYRFLFRVAFRDFPKNKRISDETTALAIAAYERTLLANRSPFQRYLRGDTGAMTRKQLRGAILFFGKAQCVDCHNGPALSSMSFHALGMDDLEGPDVFNINPDPFARREALGRGGFTKRDEDLYAFKTPQLYNLTDASFYGHGASFTSVREVLDYKNRAVAENGLVPDDKLSPDFKPLGLSKRELRDLSAFLEHALYDPDLARYEPRALPSDNCLPHNDPLSRQELGCN